MILNYLEPQLAEEPFVLACSVALLEFALHLESGLLSLRLVFDNITSCDVLIKWDIDQVTGWHEMGVVVALDEWLDTATFLPLLLVVLPVDWLWIPLNAGNNGVSVALVRVTIIVILQYDGFSSGISAGQYNDHLAWFHNLSHCGLVL